MEAHDTAFARLERSSLEALTRNVQLRDRCAVELHAALLDQAPRLARRPDAEALDEQRGQMERVALRQRRLGHVVRDLAPAVNRRPAPLRPRRRLPAVPLLDDAARQ